MNWEATGLAMTTSRSMGCGGYSGSLPRQMTVFDDDAVGGDLVATAATETADQPLFSLVSGEGDGFMLGFAAGDAAGGAWEMGYSAVTEQVTVISYQLIENRHLDPTLLVSRLRELDGAEDEGNVYRSETPHFRAWLDRAAAGSAVPEMEPSTDGIARGVPIGVAFRKEPEKVVEEAVAVGRMFHRDASCFGQSGRDLISGVAETVVPALPAIREDLGGPEKLNNLEQEFDQLALSVRTMSGPEALTVIGDEPQEPVHQALRPLLWGFC